MAVTGESQLQVRDTGEGHRWDNVIRSVRQLEKEEGEALSTYMDKHNTHTHTHTHTH